MINSLSKGVFGFGRRSNAAWLGGVLCLLILLISNSGRALAESQAAIDVSQLSASIPVSQQVRFFIDHDDRKVSDVLESDAPWQFNSESVTNYGQRAEPLWLHFKIKGTQALPVTAFLKLNYNHLDDLKVFYAVDQKSSSTSKPGIPRRLIPERIPAGYSYFRYRAPLTRWMYSLECNPKAP